MSRSKNLCIGVFLATFGCTAGQIVDPPGGGGTGSDGSGTGSGPGSNNGSGSPDDSGPDVAPSYPTQHPRIYLGPNRARLTAALAASTPAATRFKGVVDSWLGGTDFWGFQAWNAALLGQLTGNAAYCTKAIATVDAHVAAAEAAIAGGGAPIVANDSYLDVGGYVGDVALVYDWCFDAVSASQRARWLAYADQAVWNVWHPSQATWGGRSFPWTGWATNDPSDNYYYSFLRATMLLGLAAHGEDTQADAWIAQFRDTKILGQLVPTFQSDLVGGGSREGTGYGVAMRGLWMLYDWWEATTGERLAKKTTHTRASMLAFLHQVVPTLDRFAPTGDQSRDSTASFFDYQRNYLQELVKLYPHDTLSGRAQTLLAGCSVPAMGNSFMAVDDFLYTDASISATALEGGSAYYASGIGELYARSAWDKHATWVNMIAGPYTQSHAHQDQGSLMIYKDGWLAYDAVVDSHSGLRQETYAHSLVRVDSGGGAVTQIANTMSNLVALHGGPGWLYASADLTPAYGGNAAITKMQREIVYLLPDVIVVYDRVTSASGTQQTWQLAVPSRPAIAGTSATVTGAHALHVQRLAPAGASPAVHDFKQDSTGDYGGGFRLDETIAGGDRRYLHVLSIDGAAASASAADDSTVTVQLAGGHSATIQFAHDAPGATLTYDGATSSLAIGVDTLPE